MILLPSSLVSGQVNEAYVASGTGALFAHSVDNGTLLWRILPDTPSPGSYGYSDTLLLGNVSAIRIFTLQAGPDGLTIRGLTLQKGTGGSGSTSSPSSSPSPSDVAGFQSGPGNVPGPLLKRAVDALNLHVCTSGSLRSVTAEGSIRFSDLQRLEPNAAASVTGTAYTPPPSTLIYAVAVTGSCDYAGQTLVEGYAEFLGDGTIIVGHAWPAASAPSISEPFGATIDQLGL
jgi:hypothetical protein